MEGRPHKIGAWVCERSWVLVKDTKPEQYRNKKAREDKLQEIVQDLHFSAVAAEDLKLGIKIIRTRYSAESAKIIIQRWCRPTRYFIKSFHSYTTLLCLKLFGFKKHIHSCLAFAFHERDSQQRLFFLIIFPHFLIGHREHWHLNARDQFPPFWKALPCSMSMKNVNGIWNSPLQPTAASAPRTGLVVLTLASWY
jgi:hypothetical protein